MRTCLKWMPRMGIPFILLLSLGFSAHAADVIKVGLSVSLSGPNASIGIPYVKGMKAAEAYRGEVAGHEVKLIILDDNSSPTQAASNARKLVEVNKVDVLIGTSGAPSTVAMAQVARSAEVPMVAISPLSTDPSKNHWVVTVAQPAQLMIDAMVDGMKANGVKTVGYIGYSDTWGDLVYKALVNATEKAGIKVVSNQRYARPDTSVTGQALHLITANPDAIQTGGSGSPGALPYLALDKLGYEGKIYGNHGEINSAFVKLAGASANGDLFPTGPVIVADQLPDGYPTKEMGLTFRRVYQEVNGEPTVDAFSAYSWDAWLVATNAAKHVLENTDAEPGSAEFRTALRDAIFSTTELVGTHGVYNFQPGKLYGVDERAAVVVKLQDGKWQFVSE